MDKFLLNRFKDLANKCNTKNIYTNTSFLNLQELEDFHTIKNEVNYVPFELYGGYPEAERRILRYGSADSLGYEQPYPILAIKISPLMEKYADKLTHRDYLGAILNLGLERNTLGDILIHKDHAVVYCMENVADFISSELTRIKHTSVSCTILNPEEYLISAPPQEFEDITVSVASERADLILAKIINMSRSKIIELFAANLVTRNSRIITSNSTTLKAGDIISVRGYGKFKYEGSSYTNKKGKLVISIKKYL